MWEGIEMHVRKRDEKQQIPQHQSNRSTSMRDRDKDAVIHWTMGCNEAKYSETSI